MAGTEQTSRTATALLIAGALVLASCAARPQIELAGPDSTPPTTAPVASTLPPTVTTSPVDELAASTNDDTGASDDLTTDDELLAGGVDPRTLITTPRGEVVVQPTPAVLQNRSLQTVSPLTPPSSDAYEFTIAPLAGEPLERSTWNELCPVAPTELRYLTVAFWGFDGSHQTGELIVAADQAEAIAAAFGELHAVRFPIEEMRIVTPSDVVARRTGDGNNTASYVCRQVTGGTRFSEHALGLAIDINPFQNPYQRDEDVIPALASSYLDRTELRPGMIIPGDPTGDAVIAAFARAGWAWGGDWNSLKDYQHFALNNR